jgi:hypothetical protein
VRDISKWFEARSSEQDSAGIRRHLDNLMHRLTRTASRPPHGEASVPDALGTVPDSEHPDEPVNSL